MNYVRYEVTGVLYRSHKRFKLVYQNPMWAYGINLLKGSVWGVLENGKRKLLKRV